MMRRAAPLYALYAAHTVSLAGNMITLLALPLYVLDRTGSASATGVAGVVATLPVVLGGLFGGTVVDRLGYRRSSILTDLAGGSVILLVPILDVTVGVPLWAVFVLVFVGGLIDAPGQTARHALLPEVAEAAGVPLERAVGWMEAASRGSRMLGAPAAGALVVGIGALEALFVDAATFAISALLVLRLVRVGTSAVITQPAVVTEPMGDGVVTPAASPAGDVAGPERLGYWKELRAGLAFVAQDRLLRASVALVVVTNLFDAANSTVLLPVYADRELGGAVALGLMVGATGAGALAGALLFGAIGHRLPRRATLVVAFTIAGGPTYLALAAGLPLEALLVFKVVAGLFIGAINPIFGTVMLERIPAHMRARVFGLVDAGCWAGMPLGALLAGFAVDHAGLRPTLVAIGVCYLVATLQPARGGVWREMDRIPAEVESREPEVGRPGLHISRGSGSAGAAGQPGQRVSRGSGPAGAAGQPGQRASRDSGPAGATCQPGQRASRDNVPAGTTSQPGPRASRGNRR